MTGLEAKTGTQLEWIAVDHHDTDNPHTHILVRGRRSDGRDLFIPPKLIGSGIREHAQEIVTRVLGPRQQVDLVRERTRDIEILGPSSLDKELFRSRDRLGHIHARRPDLVARLERLEGWALASRGPEGGVKKATSKPSR
jgi:type IV secretory pathway VirD2 relaxase